MTKRGQRWFCPYVDPCGVVRSIGNGDEASIPLVHVRDRGINEPVATRRRHNLMNLGRVEDKKDYGLKGTSCYFSHATTFH